MINSYKTSGGGSAKLILDTVQRELQCCGYDSMEDWFLELENAVVQPRGDSRSSSLNRSLPDSCCPAEIEECSPEHAFSSPCRESIMKNYLSPNNAIGLIGTVWCVN